MHRSRAAHLLLRLAVVLGGLAVLLLAIVYTGSEWILRRHHEVAASAIAATSSPADLEEGRRLAVIVGCWEGCHGPRGEGGFEEAPGIFRITAPALSDVLPQYSDPELVRLIRLGVKRDGKTALGMPSRTFYPLADADLVKIVGHLRRQPLVTPIPRERRITLLGRAALLSGKWKASADQVDRSSPRWGELPRTTSFERGRYLASVTCTECHGSDLQGDQYMGSPSLMVGAGYPAERFRHLLQTGEPLSGRDLGIMSRVARSAFRYFSDEEIQDVHVYLRTRFGVPQTDVPGTRH
jgi:mono/diheme cytochrome c family protein